MRILSFIFILGIFACGSFAESQPLFDVLMAPSIADPHLDLWFYTRQESGPIVPQVTKVYCGQTFMLLMFTRVHPVDSQTKADITCDLKIISPKNTLASIKTDIFIYKGKTVLNKIILPKDVIELRFDRESGFGIYKIEAVFNEKISGRSYTATTTVELVPFDQPEKFVSREECGKFFMEYYKNPDPVKSFSAILYHVQTDPNWIEDNYSGLAFYRYILTKDPFLWEYYSRMYKTVSADDKKKMLLVAAVIPSKQKDNIFVPEIGSELMPLYKKFSEIHIPQTDKELTTGMQLDILWMEFFASGKYEPIKHIVSSLALQKYEGTLEKIKNKEIELTKETKKQAILGAVYQSAVWSLTSNCLNYDLVYQYCTTMYERESLSPKVKKSLAGILAAVELKKQKDNAKNGLQK